jgi:hypothetical protein
LTTESLSGFGLDVLRNGSGIGMATLTEARGVFATWTVEGMAGEVLHNMGLIFAGQPTNNTGGRMEFDTAKPSYTVYGR